MVQFGEAAIAPLDRSRGPRSRGRPRVRTDEETRSILVEAAVRMFQLNGYAGTSMNALAGEAGVSTKTLYRLIPTKADLFRLVIAHRIGRFILAIDENTTRSLPIADALERILVAYGTLTLSAETIALNRLVIAETDRFPEIAKGFYEAAIVPTAAAMAGWLQRQCDDGLIQLHDVPGATTMLRGMMIMETQRSLMLGQREPLDGEEIVQRARDCAGLFLNGCRRERLPVDRPG